MNRLYRTTKLHAVQGILGMKCLSINEKLDDIFNICTKPTVNTIIHLLAAPEVNEKAVVQKVFAFCLIFFIFVFVMNGIKVGIYIAVGSLIAVALAMNGIPHEISMVVGLIITAVIAVLGFGGTTDKRFLRK